MIGDLGRLVAAAATSAPPGRSRWAVVTQTSPLRIRFDDETDETPATPQTLVAGLRVGQRVWAQHVGTRVVIIGPAGGDGAWKSYTPTVATSGTQPNLGTGATQEGRYALVGGLVAVQGRITLGTSPTGGTNTWVISAPVPIDTAMLNGNVGPIGRARCIDSSSSDTGYFDLRAATSIPGFVITWQHAWPTGSQVTVNGTTPWTWADGDSIYFWAIYQAADG